MDNKEAASAGAARSENFTASIVPHFKREIDKSVYAVTVKRGWPVMLQWGVTDGICACPKGADCAHPGKHTHGESWIAVTYAGDELGYSEWLKFTSSIPDPNYGLRLDLSGNCVVDLDRHHDGQDGIARWTEMTVGHQVDATFTVESGGGGLQFHYECPDWLTQRADLSDGVELLTKTVTGPGSMHASGRRYRVLDPSPVVPMPGWMQDELRRRIGTQRRADDGRPVRMADGDPRLEQLRTWSEAGLSDERNRAAVALYGMLIAHGVDVYVARQFMSHWNADNATPLPQRILRDVLTSVLRMEARKSG